MFIQTLNTYKNVLLMILMLLIAIFVPFMALIMGFGLYQLQNNDFFAFTHEEQKILKVLLVIVSIYFALTVAISIESILKDFGSSSEV